MAIFENKTMTKIAKDLDVTKAELTDFVTKATDSFQSLDRMIQREHGSSATYDTLTRDYYRIGDAYYNNIFVRKSIDKIAGMISGVDVVIQDSRGNDLPDNNPAQKLFQYINNEDSSYDFFYEIVRSLQRYGKVFIHSSDIKSMGAKLPISLDILDADKMKAKLDENNILSYWEYCGKNKIPTEEVLFIKFKHPDDPYDGLAPGSSAVKEVLQDFYAHVYNIKNFQNGAMGAGAWVDPNGSNLTPQQKNEAQMAVDNEFNRGVDGASKQVVLSRKLEWVRTSESNRDLDFLNLLNKMRDDILVAYDIPKVLFTSADATFTNLQEAKKLFWSQTLLPIIKKIEDSFNTNFFAPLGLDYKLHFNTGEISELQDDIATKMLTAQAMYAMNIPMSVINETLGLGLAEWPGMDDKPFSFDTPIDNTKDLPVVPNANEIIKEYKKQEAWNIEKGLAYDEFLLQQEYTKSLNTMLSRERDLSGDVKAFYAQVWKDQIEPWMNRAGVDKAVNKTVVDDFKVFIKGLNMSIPFIESVKDNIKRTFNLGVYRSYSGIGADFTLSDQRTIAFLTNRGLKLKDSPDVVKERILALLESDGFTIDEMAKEVSKVWKESSLERAKVVSVTETTSAYNGGRIEGMKELGIKKKKWVHSHDVKVRNSHQISETVEVDQQFTLADGYKASYPGDGDAAHSANCRCVVISVLD